MTDRKHKARTLRPKKQCTSCYKKCQELLDLACRNEKLETALEQESARCTSLYGQLTKEREVWAKFNEKLQTEFSKERHEWCDFMEKLKLVQQAGADTLCGSKWINAAGLTQVLADYTNGRCAR